jgi:hypothetical protein
MYKTITEISGITFGNLNEIEIVNNNNYSTCRGTLPIGFIERIRRICAATDYEIDTTVDLANDVNDGILWDELCHQGTLYSASPIGYYYIAKISQEIGINNKEIKQFIEHCVSVGSGGVFLSDVDLVRNKLGIMPIFRVEDISLKFGFV